MYCFGRGIIENGNRVSGIVAIMIPDDDPGCNAGRLELGAEVVLDKVRLFR